MQRFYFLIFFFTLMQAALASAPPDTSVKDEVLGTEKPLDLLLDPGHGGSDSGAVFEDGKTKESHVALQLAKVIQSVLREQGLRVELTRESDQNLSLEERAHRANKDMPRLFASIHLNSSTDPRAKGLEVYFQNQLPTDEEALLVAHRENSTDDEVLKKAGDNSLVRVDRSGLRQAELKQIPKFETADLTSAQIGDLKMILEDLDRNLRIKKSSFAAISFYKTFSEGHPASSKALRQAPFFLVTHVAVPSLLVEVGYLSNLKERAKLTDPSGLRAVANSVATGLKVALKTAADREQNLKSEF